MFFSLPPLALLAVLSRLTNLVLAQDPPSESSPNTTVSLWLPWLQYGIDQNLEASVIQAAPDATTYLLSCPSDTTSDPDTTDISALCLLDAPQTITAAPTLAIASFVQEDITREWNCSLSNAYDATAPVTAPPSISTAADAGEQAGECGYKLRATSATVGSRMGPVLANVDKAYGVGDISLQRVTVTAGELEPTAAATTTSERAVMTGDTVDGEEVVMTGDAADGEDGVTTGGATDGGDAVTTGGAADGEDAVTTGGAANGNDEQGGGTDSGAGKRDTGLVGWSMGVTSLVVIMAVGL